MNKNAEKCYVEFNTSALKDVKVWSTNTEIPSKRGRRTHP